MQEIPSPDWATKPVLPPDAIKLQGLNSEELSFIEIARQLERRIDQLPLSIRGTREAFFAYVRKFRPDYTDADIEFMVSMYMFSSRHKDKASAMLDDMYHAL
jgi:hypothetical protein